LGRQFAMRFTYLITKQWSKEQLEGNLECLVHLFYRFIQFCETLVDMRFVLLGLERLGESQKIINAFANDHSFLLLECFSGFLQKHFLSSQLEQAIDGILKFVQKLAKIEQSHDAIVGTNICELIFSFVSKPQNVKVLKSIIDVAPGKDNEGDIIRILGNIRGAIKITQSLLMSNVLSEDSKDDLLTKFSSKCS
jgi:hypothetical protein